MPLLIICSTLIPARISNHMPIKILVHRWRKWISNFIFQASKWSEYIYTYTYIFLFTITRRLWFKLSMYCWIRPFNHTPAAGTRWDVKYFCSGLDILLIIHESLQWHHNGRDGISNQQPQYCLLNRLFRRGSKKTSKHRVTGLCAGNSPVTGEFPAQKGSNAENFPFDDVIMMA